jgi:arginyl-tRNA synthetase
MSKESYHIAHLLSTTLGEPIDQIEAQLVIPKEYTHGDLTFAVFSYAKKKQVPPQQLAQQLCQLKYDPTLISQVSSLNGYVNFQINPQKFASDIITSALTKKEEYGSSIPLVFYQYVLDYSAPNIAKPFGIGHLRSTVIGDSIKRILEFSGHKVIGLNYIGDWGTQFGKVITAYKLWGNPQELAQEPIAYLLQLYVRFHEEAQTNPALEDMAREVFAQLEKQHEEYLSLWNTFRDLSIAEFEKTYAKLQVEFSLYRGESYYNDKMQETLALLQSKGLLTTDQGCQIIDFSAHGIELPPLIIVKSNEGSTYALRDITSAIDRIKNLGADFLLYEVGAEQKLHFAQVIQTLKLAGFDFADRMVHIDHGFYKLGTEKFSTRKGNIILMNDVIEQAIQKAKDIIAQKNPQLVESAEFETIAQAIGVGAIKFFDLSTDRVKDVSFNWEHILDFQGETGPYVQYSHVRMCSILTKAQKKLSLKTPFTSLTHPLERKLLVQINQFQYSVNTALKQFKPHTLARYALDISQTFNEYYQQVKIVTDDEQTTNERLLLVASARQALANALYLLGIEPLKQM